MIRKILLVGIVGVLFYVIIPAISQSVKQQRRKRMLKKLKSRPGIFASCTDFRNDTISITPVGTAGEKKGPLTINPARTRFFMLEKDGSFEAVAWKSVFLIRNGVTLCYYPGKTRLSRGICLFHEEITESDLTAHITKLTGKRVNLGHIPDPVKHLSVALGAFLEFCLFLDSLKYPELNQVSIAALVAIFGKALPYCPPGLFFTLAAQLIVNRAGQKKSRRRAAVGFILITTGVLLNIGVIFFAILKIGFIIPGA